MDRVEDIIDENAAVNFRFKFKQKSGRHVMRLEDVSKAYGEVEILQNSTAHIERGDKIALIGANGKGKSTLLRIISGTEPIEGKREEGYNVIQGFYAQHQLEALHVNNEILEELKQAGSGKSDLELRQILGCFLFSDDDVFKKVKVLSGGEKSRVALAKTLISEANFLLLDEPTNHLDFISENILIQALQQYEGTFVVVSHNRHFISEVANKIWYIENKEIKEYPGTYKEFMYWRNEIQPPSEETNETPVVEKKDKSNPPKPRRNEDDALLKKAQSTLDGLESEILEIEMEKESLEKHMANPDIFGNPDKLFEVNQDYETVNQKIESLTRKWEKLAGEIEQMKSE